MTVSHGKPYAGKPHVRFDEGAGVPGKGRPALLHEFEWWSSGAANCGHIYTFYTSTRPIQFHAAIWYNARRRNAWDLCLPSNDR